MLTWMPKTWENVFNAGLAFSVIFLSITLITGMGGQLSLCQAHAGRRRRLHRRPVGQPPRSQPAPRRPGRARRAAGGGGRGSGRGVAPVARTGTGPDDHRRRPLLRQRHLSARSRTATVPRSPCSRSGWDWESSTRMVMPSSCWPWSSWSICIIGVLLVRKGTTGRYLAAMRGSETAAAGLGINLTWQRVLIFGISGVVAGIGGTLLSIQQQSVNANDVQLRVLPGVRGHRGHHRGQHGGGSHQRRVRASWSSSSS